MKRGLGFILLLMFFVSIFFISAKFDKGDKSHEITTTYGPGNDLQGWINISFDKEPITSVFEDSEDNSINIIDLLRSDTSLVEGLDYTCSVPGCGLSFDIIDSGSDSKTFFLDAGDEKIVGFKLIDNITDVTGASFDIYSDASPGCENQLEIDFFADEKIDYINDKSSAGECNKKNYGCFNSSKSVSNFNMNGKGSMYCQRIKLSESPGFKLGAFMNIKSGANKTNISIYNLDLDEKLVECSLDNSVTNDFEERSCEVNYSIIKSEDYYVCIFSNANEDPNTKIKGYVDKVNGCGFYTSGSVKDENYSYNISADSMKFGAVGKINITEHYPFKDGLSDEFYNYIYNTYGGDCDEGCIIPIGFSSNLDQNITVENISITYQTGGGSITETKIFDLSLISATLNSGFKIISLSNANFTLPPKYSSFTYELKLDNGTKTFLLFKEDFLIERGPIIKSLSPSSVFNKIPVNFKVNVEKVDNASIVSYTWQFGNATPVPTTTNTISHTFFSESPSVPVKITVTDSNGKIGSKIFYVKVESYLLYFNTRVGKVWDNLDVIESQISKLSNFSQGGIKKIIDTPVIRQQLGALEGAYGNASTAQEFESIVGNFLVLESNVPESIFERINTSSLSYYPNLDYIELGIIDEILGGKYDTKKTSAYKDAVLTWNALNTDSKVKYNQIAAGYEDGRIEPILNIFEFDFIKTGTGNGTLFIRELENMAFDKSYGEKIKSDYVYIPLDSGKKIKFYTTQDVGITNLPAFISPALSELTIIEEFDEAEAARMRWLLFFLIMFFLLIIAIIVYIILQQWYKYKYETYLFKNRNFLFNLIHYIDAQKKKGVREGEIFSKLKKAGWNSEQINYVIRKYLGKRTGMLELPIEKILGIFRKREIQQAGVPSAPGPIGPRPQRFSSGL